MLTAANQPMFRFLAVLTAVSMVGMQGYSIMFNNYAVETIHLDGLHVGLIQSVREIPGLLALTAIYVMLVISEHRLAALSIALLGFGVALTGLFPSFGGVAVTTLIMSFGFHYYETVNQSLTLQYFSTHQSPLVMGKLRSLAAITSIISAAVIWCLGFVMDYTGIFLVVGIVVFLAGIWALFQDPTHADIPPQKVRMFMKRRYWLYYLLTFMSGARRQIHMVFSMLLLVKVFHFSLQAITVLFIINNIINWIVNPIIGMAINWMLNYRIPFLMGAAMGVVSLALAQFIRLPLRHGAKMQQA